MYWPRKTHSERVSGCLPCHFLRIAIREPVGSCWRSATSNRKSSRSSLADSSSILATSEVDTDSPLPPLDRTFLDRSRNSRRVSEMRIERVCCCGLRSTEKQNATKTHSLQYYDCNNLYRHNKNCAIITSSRRSHHTPECRWRGHERYHTEHYRRAFGGPAASRRRCPDAT